MQWGDRRHCARRYPALITRMPNSAYVQAGAFVILTALALFGGAGTFAIPEFWLYLAIFAAVMVVSFVTLDPGLLRERIVQAVNARRLHCACFQSCCLCTGSSPGSTAAVCIGATACRHGCKA